MSKPTAVGKALGLVTVIVAELLDEIRIKGNEEGVLQVPEGVIASEARLFASQLSEAAEFYEMLSSGRLHEVPCAEMTELYKIGGVEELDLSGLSRGHKFYFVLQVKNRTLQQVLDKVHQAIGARVCTAAELAPFGVSIRRYAKFLPTMGISFLALDDPTKPMVLNCREDRQRIVPHHVGFRPEDNMPPIAYVVVMQD